MCPKAKATQVITHRIELQTKERENLDMVAASITARNVTASVGNLLTPFTQCTIAGAITATTILGGLIGAKVLADEGVTPGDVAPFIFGIIPGIAAKVDWSSVLDKIQTNLEEYPRYL